MKIAILGTRGVPPAYGGFETFAAELGVRLVARGHEVSVYCRELNPGLQPVVGVTSTVCSPGEGSPSRKPSSGLQTVDVTPTTGCRPGPSWNGIQRIVIPALHGSKYLETVSHSLLSALDAMRREFDAVLVCNAANAFVLPLLRAARIRVAINVDGIERKRRKWNVLGRAVYAIGEAFSAGFANAVIADADVIARYYREQYALETAMIPYGAEFPVEEDSDVLRRLGLQPRGYLLYVSRFEPENNPLEVVEAYEKVMPVASGELPLVMLGKGMYAPELVAELQRHAGQLVRFPGALYGADYRTLQRNALFYIQATEVGGTHPAMIEAMASGGAVLAHDTPENREAGGDSVGYFELRPQETLSVSISEWLSNPSRREDFRSRGRMRAKVRYSWERVTDQYENLLRSL